MHEEIQRQYAAGRSTGFSPDEMEALLKAQNIQNIA
jgi:hypothetical protein